MCGAVPALLQVQALLLAPSTREAGPKGCGPREASADDLMAAANVLVRSRELLDTLSAKLGTADAPVRAAAAAAAEEQHAATLHDL